VSIGERAKWVLKSVSNIHRQGPLPNVFLFATPRGGSTWVMEILASQPGVKYYDEPFNIRRANVIRTGLFPDWESLMPESGDGTQVVDYLNGLVSGAYPHMNPPPFRPNHRLITNRIVFKIHELEHLIGRIAKDCRGQVIYLLRHPIPTTLSRRVLPRLELFLASPYYGRLIGEGPELREIRRLGREGTALEKGIVSWCYENLLPLHHADFEGLFVTYEELVLNPARSCDLLLNRLQFTDRASMLEAFSQPSANINMSSKETQSMMTEADVRARRAYLVGKWKSKVTSEEVASVSRVMELFGEDVYRAEDVLSHPRYLHFEDTRELNEPTRPGAVRQQLA